MTQPDRRQFLGAALGSMLGATVPSVPSLIPVLIPGTAWWRRGSPVAGDSERILLVLQLDGGNDGLSTVTPWDDDLYYRGRGAIGIPKRDLIRLDDLNGFHPALRRLATRYEAGQMCIQQAVGYPQPNLSHFRSMDIWETASTAGTLPSTGWVGGLADQLGPGTGGGDAMAMLAVGRDSMPLALRAREHVACVVPDLGSYRIQDAPRDAPGEERAARARAIAALNARSMQRQESAVTDAYSAATRSIEQLGLTQSYEPTAAFPDTQLGASLRLVARAIGAGLPTRFYYVTHQGFDTHTDQIRMQGRLLSRLDEALDAFLADLESQGRLDDVLVLCVSEFGRRIEECGIGDTAGSDHGAANSLMAFGGKVNAGLHGGQPELGALDENGNLVMKADFRQVYADVIEHWMGGDSRAILGDGFPPLKVVST